LTMGVKTMGVKTGATLAGSVVSMRLLPTVGNVHLLDVNCIESLKSRQSWSECCASRSVGVRDFSKKKEPFLPIAKVLDTWGRVARWGGVIRSPILPLAT